MDEEPTDVGTAHQLSSGDVSSTETTAIDLEFALFYRAELPRLVGFLMTHGARAATAADVAQESMIAAYRQWDRIDSPRAWIRTVASRTWWRRKERDQREIPRDDLARDSSLLSDEEAERVEADHAFLALIRSLPMEQRQVMAWTYDGYLPNEIAVLLGKNPATVRSTLRAARAALQQRHRPAYGQETS